LQWESSELIIIMRDKSIEFAVLRLQKENRKLKRENIRLQRLLELETRRHKIETKSLAERLIQSELDREESFPFV